jgi:RNA polymerase sigma-70 factor (ECF subfamily)
MLISKNERIFRGFYRSHVSRIRSTLLRLVGAENLDDLTQEVFLKIWKGMDKVQSDQSIASWIYRVTVNVAMDHLRTNKSQKSRMTIDLDAVGKCEMEAHENKQLVLTALNNLDFDRRSVLVLHDLEQLTETEIAEMLEIPRGTVKSRLFSARKKLRSFLKESGVSL